MQFSGPFADGLAGDVQAFIDIVGLSTFLSGSAIESTKLAINVADVGGIEVSVHIEERGAAVFAAANAVSQFAKCRQIVGCEQR